MSQLTTNNLNGKNFLKPLFALLTLIFLLNFSSSACDTSPILTASNVNNIGGGFFTFDLQVCIGQNGSIDGFDVTMGCGLNITATSAASLNNGGNVAVASITGGVLTYTYPGAGGFEPDDNISGPCFTMTLTVDGNPENCSVTSTGINDGCLLIATSWTTTVPGPCVVDFVMTAPGSQAGNTTGTGSSCTLRASEDQIFQVNITCNDAWTFSLCGGGSTWDTYMYLGTSCCVNDLGTNDDFCGLQSEITATLAPGTYYVIIEGFGSTSAGTYTLDVTSANPCNPLPVSLTDFSGNYDEMSRSNSLNWTTITESNNDYFILERSTNNESFTPIGEINGSGNSLVEKSYSYFDPIDESGIFYYRLNQIDINGSSKYSNTISIQSAFDSESFITNIFPNPTKDQFTLTTAARSESSPIELEIYSSQLNLIKSMTLTGSSSASDYSIDVNSLESGIYTIRIISGSKIESRKIVIL